MTLEGSDLMLIVGGVLVVVVLLVMVIGGFSFLNKRKIYKAIQEDDKRLQDDLVNNSQHPGRFPH